MWVLAGKGWARCVLARGEEGRGGYCIGYHGSTHGVGRALGLHTRQT
jgi:hypothetical protein